MAIKIYIDQGHNPVNPNSGAEGNGLREQDLVFKIGVLLSDILKAEGFDTRLSRPNTSTQLGTSNVSYLETRVQRAIEFGADWFISLHTNASDNASASGSEAFVYRRDGSPFVMAENILSELNITTGLKNRGVFPRPSLYVLRKTPMPAVLAELGFITNPYDAELMNTRPSLFADGVADGILNYFGL